MQRFAHIWNEIHFQEFFELLLPSSSTSTHTLFLSVFLCKPNEELKFFQFSDCRSSSWHRSIICIRKNNNIYTYIHIVNCALRCMCINTSHTIIIFTLAKFTIHFFLCFLVYLARIVCYVHKRDLILMRNVTQQQQQQQ